MDGHRSQALTDEGLDREIAAALAVEPSPEFRARVRARVATEQPGAAWWRSPAMAGISLVLATVGLMVGWVAWNGAPRNAVAPRVAERAPVVTAPAQEVLAAAPRAVRADREAPSRRNDSVVVRRYRYEVMVSPDDAAALRQLVVAIGARQVVAADIPPLELESAPLSPLEEIVLEPIKLSPIAGLESE